MKTVQIEYKSIKDIQRFVALADKCPYNIDLEAGRYAVDGKSFLGVLSIGPEKIIKMILDGDECQEFLESIKFCLV